MGAMTVPSSFLFRLGNWSPGFVMAYKEFVDLLMSDGGGSNSSDLFRAAEALLESIPAEANRKIHHLFDDVINGTKDIREASGEVRRRLFYHTKSNLFGKGEVQAFDVFVARWIESRLDRKIELAEAELLKLRAWACEAKKKISKL